MPWTYVSRDTLKSAIGVSDTTDDTRLRGVLEGVSRGVDQECHRTFRIYQGVRYYSAGRQHPYEINPVSEYGLDLARRLLVDDILAVNSLKTDGNGDTVYETTWQTTDYDLTPYNAALEFEPYDGIDRTLNGNYSFPIGVPKGVQIDAKWGYFEDLIGSGATLNAGIDSSVPSIVLASGGGALLQSLQTVLVDSEQMYVTGISGDTITVERAVNGTTAASHLAAASLSVYRYPSPIVEATLIQAARIYRRKDAPFGVTGSADLGQAMVIARLDPDVRQGLATFRRLAVPN